MKLPFDRVVLSDEGGRLELTVEQFLELPLDKRIRYVLSRDIEFFQGTARVERRLALASLRDSALTK